MSELQSDTKVHEVICADVNAHDTARDKTANPNARGEYLVNAVVDANSTFLNEPEQTTRQDLAFYLFLMLRSSMLPFETDMIGNRLKPHHQTIVLAQRLVKDWKKGDLAMSLAESDLSTIATRPTQLSTIVMGNFFECLIRIREVRQRTKTTSRGKENQRGLEIYLWVHATRKDTGAPATQAIN